MPPTRATMGHPFHHGYFVPLGHWHTKQIRPFTHQEAGACHAITEHHYCRRLSLSRHFMPRPTAKKANRQQHQEQQRQHIPMTFLVSFFSGQHWA